MPPKPLNVIGFTGNSKSYLKWLVNGRWVKEEITAKEYKAIETALPKMPQSFKGTLKEWTNMWVTNQAIAFQRPELDTPDGEFKFGDALKLPDDTLIFTTDDMDNGVHLVMEKDEYNGILPIITAKVSLPSGFDITSGIISKT